MCVVMVGAVNVSAIETRWQGLITPPQKSSVVKFPSDGTTLEKGEHMGTFHMGSTIILLFSPKTADFFAPFAPGDKVKMGSAIGSFIEKT